MVRTFLLNLEEWLDDESFLWSYAKFALVFGGLIVVSSWLITLAAR